MPGGAPLRRSRSSRPCKYGARDEDGRCPKAPKRAAAAKAPRAKAPCKYGERDADGRCPKKPKSARAAKAPTVKKLKSVDGAARQAGEVLRSDKATKAQKHEAVKVLGSAVAGEASKKVAGDVARQAKKAVRQSGGARAVAKKVAKVAAGSAAVRAGAVGAGIAGTLYVGGKALDANRRREAAKWAAKQVSLTKKRLAPQKLTPEQEATLYRQYFDHFVQQPVTNPFLGK
jgi:hypothetical protein